MLVRKREEFVEASIVWLKVHLPHFVDHLNDEMRKVIDYLEDSAIQVLKKSQIDVTLKMMIKKMKMIKKTNIKRTKKKKTLLTVELHVGNEIIL